MKIALSMNHLKRYKEIALLLWKYGRSDLVRQMGIDASLSGAEPAAPGSADDLPAQLADDLEAMGPTYVKLGQLLSSQPDLLPEVYCKALARLQDQVKPFPFAEVETIVTSELGVRISKAFSRFDAEPIAAASLAQVHFAVLRDGRAVVVKVQRPGIAAQIADDFEVLAQIAEFLDEHTELGRRHRFLSTLKEMRIAIQQELNYEREAQNLVIVAKNLAEFELIHVPQPIPDYSTRRVLTMTHVRGRKITAIGPLAHLEMEGSALADALFRAYLKQVLVDGIFHADPHPGNVFITEDRHIALLDLGLVGHTAPSMQEHLLKLLLAISDGKTDVVTQVAMDVGQPSEHYDAVELRRRMTQLETLRPEQGLRQVNVGGILLRVTRIAGDSGLLLPRELTLLGKTLLQLDEVGKILDPAFDASSAIKRAVTELMSQRMQKNMSQGSALSSLLEIKDFIAGLPSRLNRVLDAVSNAELEVKVRAVDATLVIEGMQKIANRITMGIILAALIVGASLLMRVETAFRILDYPGLAMIFFLLAATGGIWLLIDILVQDRHSKQRT